ncbi:MAG: glycoside hydrolase family 38 C-terminal domain-containing protein [Clostridiales bacterium]|nr:glycoside hydrolase family 38 C-terminal domain-containing protein [Clostridiales bacterium]
MNNIDKWIDEVKELTSKISEAGQIGICTFAQGNVEDCEMVNFDDSAWEKVMGKSVPINGINTGSGGSVQGEAGIETRDWNMSYGEAALRKQITYPSTVEGICTDNAKISITMTILAPVQVFLDGVKIADFKYWGDTRHCELCINENHKKGQKYLLVLKTPETGGDAYLGIYINCDILEKQMLELMTAVEQLLFTQKLALLHGSEINKYLDILERKLDTDTVRNRNWVEIRKQLELIDEVLKNTDVFAKEFKVHMIAHAHIDMNWLWDYQDTEDICIRDFRTICNIMDENPDLRFSQSQSCVYDIVQKKDPATFERVLKKIQEGTWEVTAATWSENDLNMTGGETMARNLYHASDYAKEVLKTIPSRVVWEPDTFGHPTSTPNILAKAGVEYYYHFRCPRGAGLTWWEGTDGSRILDFAFGPYNNMIRPQNVMPVVHSLFDHYGLKSSMFVFGVGDHGGGPTKYDIKVKRYLDQKPGLPRFVFSKVCDFFDEVLILKKDFPVVKDEQNPIFAGCYTTKTKIKKYARDGEAGLLNAESVLAYQSTRQDQIHYMGELTEAWKDLGFLGFHDIICGCGNHAQDEYDYALGKSIVDRAEKTVNGMFHINESDQVISVYNQLAQTRSEVVRVDAPSNIPPAGTLKDADGCLIPYQIEDGKLHFTAQDLLPLSVTKYLITNEKIPGTSVRIEKTGTPKSGGFLRAETERYVMELSMLTGTIMKLYDKKEKKHVLEEMQPYAEDAGSFCAHKSSNLLKISFEQPRIMSAWILGNEYKYENIIGIPEISIAAKGPVFTTIKILHTYNKTTIEQYITLYTRFDRIDFKADVDWQEFGSDVIGVPTLKVGITSDIQKPDFIYETPFGSITRGRHNTELPSYRYTAVSGEERTLAMFNNCKFGFSAQGSTLSMTMVRGSYSPSARPDEGMTSTCYALKPYYGLTDKAELTRDAASFNQPPIAACCNYDNSNNESPLLQCDNKNIWISCVKPAFNRDAIVVRIMECCGQKTETALKLHQLFNKAYITDIKEEIQTPVPVNDGEAVFSLGANEIITVLITK